MTDNDYTPLNQSMPDDYSSANDQEMGTSTMTSPPYSISSGDDAGGDGPGSYVDVPASMPEEYGVCEDPALQEGQMAAQPDATATIQNFNPANLGTNTFAGLINGLLGGPGSSAEITLEVGLGVGASIGVAEAFGGILLKLGGKAEIDPTGKFKLEGMLGFGGYLRAEAAFIFEAAVRRMGNIKMEGEFDSVNHFSEYCYNRIVSAAQGILREMRRHVSDRYIPDTLIQLAQNTVGRVRGPEVTTSRETQTQGSISVGNDAGGVSWELGHTSSSYQKERDGRTTDRGSQTVIEGAHGISIGDYEGSIAFKGTETDSTMDDNNDKKEFELKIGISGVANQLDEVGSRRLTSLVERTSSSMNSLASMAATAGSAMLNLVSGGTLYTGRPTVPDLETGARGSLNLVFKWEKTTGDYEIKFAAVNFGYSMNIDSSAQFPIPGTPLMGEGTANLTAQFVRNIFLINF